MTNPEKKTNTQEGVSSPTHDCCATPAGATPASATPGGTRGGIWRGGAVAIGAAILASACCWLPLVLLAVGASAAGAAASVIASLRYPLLALAAITLGIGFYRVYFRRSVNAQGAACCDTGSPSRAPSGRLALWIATVLVILFAGFPYYGAGLISAVSGGSAAIMPGKDGKATPAQAANQSAKNKLAQETPFLSLYTYDYKVKGMDCSACAAGLQAMVAKLPGVKSARVSYSHGTAVIVADPHVFKPATITQKLTSVGYPTALSKKGPTSNASAMTAKPHAATSGSACCP
jgi:copper chaperone CopZ